MRVLLIGVGTVGEAIVRLSAERDCCEAMVVADYDETRARTVADALGGAPRFTAVRIDARDASAVTELARAYRADLVMNAVDPQFVMPVFAGALEADANYVDIAGDATIGDRDVENGRWIAAHCSAGNPRPASACSGADSRPGGNIAPAAG